MSRKINFQRVNKLLNIIVIGITIISLTYFTFLGIKESNAIRMYSEGVNWCSFGQEWCYAFWHKYLSDYRNAQLWSLIIGICLPIVFFGGKAIVNYITTEDKKQR